MGPPLGFVGVTAPLAQLLYVVRLQQSLSAAVLDLPPILYDIARMWHRYAQNPFSPWPIYPTPNCTTCTCNNSACYR